MGQTTVTAVAFPTARAKEVTAAAWALSWWTSLDKRTRAFSRCFGSNFDRNIRRTHLIRRKTRAITQIGQDARDTHLCLGLFHWSWHTTSGLSLA